jgi:hypothetical protein
VDLLMASKVILCKLSRGFLDRGRLCGEVSRQRGDEGGRVLAAAASLRSKTING